MKVVLEDAGVCRKIMRVHVPSDMVAPEYDKVLKEYARKAKIPGFRQGRAPSDVVERGKVDADRREPSLLCESACCRAATKTPCSRRRLTRWLLLTCRTLFLKRSWD